MRYLSFLLLSSVLLATCDTDKLAASDWSQIRAEYDRHRHAFVATESGYAARNPGNGWVARLDGKGFTLDADKAAWQWGLELRSVSGQAAVHGYKPSITGNTLTYHRGEQLDEWFTNRPSGLEHGYTVHQRPANGLSFRLAVRGALRASGSGDAVRFTRDGVTVLTYSGLKAWDANRNPLPARMTGYGSELELIVDDSGVKYPVTVDPTIQVAYAKASNPSLYRSVRHQRRDFREYCGRRGVVGRQ